MFGNIKKKFSNAIQEGISLSENLSALHLKVTSPDRNFTKFPIPSKVNLAAGSQLLRQYETAWEDIHRRNEENATLAENIDASILGIQKRSDKMNIDMTDLNSCLSGMPALQGSLKSCVQTLHDIGQLCEALEVKIVELEDVCEECEMQEKQLEEKFQISMYKNKKMVKLESFRQKLADKHNDNVRVYENQLRQLQMERQAVFEDAFRLDMEDFKKRGSLPKLEHKSTSKSELALEEVELDDDSDNKDDLENFLNE